MSTNSAPMLTIRLTESEKLKFQLLAKLNNKTISSYVKDLIDKELKAKKYSQSELRKLPKEFRNKILSELTETAIPIYNKYKKELFVDETGDGF
ncbi:MAG: hypothetical protein V1779_12245 [bacterium]